MINVVSVYAHFQMFLSITEICAISKISKKEIGRCFKLILKALETSVEIITTGDFMVRVFVGFKVLFPKFPTIYYKLKPIIFF